MHSHPNSHSVPVLLPPERSLRELRGCWRAFDEAYDPPEPSLVQGVHRFQERGGHSGYNKTDTTSTVVAAYVQSRAPAERARLRNSLAKLEIIDPKLQDPADIKEAGDRCSEYYAKLYRKLQERGAFMSNYTATHGSAVGVRSPEGTGELEVGLIIHCFLMI